MSNYDELLDDRVTAIEVTPCWAGDLPNNAVDAALKAAGVPDDLLPKRPARAVAMRRAFDKLAPRGAKIDMLPAGLGVTMSLKDKGALDLAALSAASGVTVREAASYHSTLSAKIFVQNINGTEIETLNFTPDDHPMVRVLRDTYRVQRDLYKTSEDLSVWFSQMIIPAVAGVGKRARGGVYYIPATQRTLLLAVARGLEQVSTWSSISREVGGVSFPVHRLVHGGKLCLEPRSASDAAAMEILVDGVIREADTAIDQMAETLAANTGEKLLGTRALNSKRAECARLENEIAAWEQVTSVSLDLLRDRITELRSGIAMAEMAKELADAAKV